MTIPQLERVEQRVPQGLPCAPEDFLLNVALSVFKMV
jgi:hypothetical protein